MKLSAIIPTYERPDALRRCLETLQAQDLDASQLEVVVVDDGSRSDIGGVVAAVSAQGPIPMRYERQELAGLNSARNRGAAAASGEVLAFLDDDTLVSSGWARAFLSAFDGDRCAGAGGRVELSLAAPAPAWLAEVRHYLAEYDLGSEARWLDVDKDRVPVGANCAVRRSDFNRVGGFLSGFDRIADSLISNGDTEFFCRLRAAGGTLRYEPEAHVIHCVPADRLTVRFFIRRHQAQGVSDELLFKLQGGHATLGYRVFLVRELSRVGIRFCLDLFHRRDTANARFWGSYWAGRISGLRMRPPASDALQPTEAHTSPGPVDGADRSTYRLEEDRLR